MASPKSVDKACPRAVRTDKHAGVAANEDLVKGVFNRYDTNKDGFLRKQELKKAFASLGSRMPRVRASLALRHADVNGDGYIGQAELDKLVKYTLKRGYKFK
ncbi:putative Calcium-binding EF-hand family protein [Hibiscus syriacus]|uniref:Calcium-binding EF-hand family protein n=1 Tax=Hibiscus syriacus TaxID=106335 RepID=A0A6A3CJ52_HIBSY|nr:putative Calcium-binding EF-hand family protein [Hibiscus syriacus]